MGEAVNFKPKDVLADEVPAIGVSISHQVAEDRNLVFQTHLAGDCSPAVLNAYLDKAFRASERQKARVRLPQAKKDLARLEKAHQRATEDILRLDAERDAARAEWQAAANRSEKRNPGSTAQQRAHEQKNAADRANALTTHNRIGEDIGLLKAEIAELEAAIAADE